MKKIVKSLEKQLEQLQELVQHRYDKFADRSENWQESEKGQEWDDKTMDIESQADELDSVIASLKELD